MAGVIPATAPPGFGAAYADRQNTARQLDQRMVDSDVNRRATLAGNIINSAPAIASVAGSGAIDRLLNMYADSETPVFNNQYSQMMDRLRMMSAMPKPAGGGKKDDGGLKAGQAVIYNPTSQQNEVVKLSDLDETFRTMVLNGNNGYKVVQMGPQYTPAGTPSASTGGGGGGATVPEPKNNGDGTWTLLDGRVVDENGIEVDG